MVAFMAEKMRAWIILCKIYQSVINFRILSACVQTTELFMFVRSKVFNNIFSDVLVFQKSDFIVYSSRIKSCFIP